MLTFGILSWSFKRTTADRAFLIDLLIRDFEWNSRRILFEDLQDRQLDDPFASIQIAFPLHASLSISITEDGGTRMIPSPKVISPCIVYGIGLAGSIQFETAMAKEGCQVYGFDCTATLPKISDVQNVKFFPWCVGEKSSNVRGSIYTARHGSERVYTFKSLREITTTLGHHRITVLKFDIEGFEWSLLQDELLKLDAHLLPEVLVFELHTEGANSNFVLPELVAGRGERQVRRIFVDLWEKGYRVVSKRINVGDKFCADFVMVLKG